MPIDNIGNWHRARFNGCIRPCAVMSRRQATNCLGLLVALAWQRGALADPPAQDTDPFRPLLHKSRNRSANKSTSDTPAVVLTLKNIEKLTSDLRKAWTTAQSPTLPRMYLKSLEFHSTTLDNLKATLEQLQEVENDLQAKAAFASSAQLASSSTFGASVQVIVHTRRGDRVVPGLYVRGNPKLAPDGLDPLVVFSSATSPTSMAVSPGDYFFWIEDASGNELTRQPMTIGRDNKDPQEIRMEVPARVAP